MSKLAVFYHGVFVDKHSELFPASFFIVREQMQALEASGLAEAADRIIVGINGEPSTSMDYAKLVIPQKAKIAMHGSDSFAENLTLVEIEKFIHGHEDWLICYHHSKSATHSPLSDYGQFATRWRRCMERSVIWNWRTCVEDLDHGYESVGCHWMTGLGSDHSQNIWAGNFWWAKASFLATLPSIYERQRIKDSGIAAAESRFESEVWIGNGSRLPRVRDYAADHSVGGCPSYD